MYDGSTTRRGRKKERKKEKRERREEGKKRERGGRKERRKGIEAMSEKMSTETQRKILERI